jgi:hypothetical protein
MFSTELYALISETLVGSASLTALCILVWLFRGNSGIRFVDYFRCNAKRFLYGPDESTATQPSYLISKDLIIIATGAEDKGGDNKKGGVGEALFYPIVAALILGLGLAVESTVDDAIDSNPIGLNALSKGIRYLVGSKVQHRFGVLYRAVDHDPKNRPLFSFGNPEPCDGENASRSFELTSLGVEILTVPKELITPFIPNPAQMTKSAEQRWLAFLSRPDLFLAEDPFLPVPDLTRNLLPRDNVSWSCTTEDLKECDHQKASERTERCNIASTVAQGLYYDGNNWAKRNESTASVLRRWEIQIDTVGSLAAIATMIALVTAAYLVVVSLRQMPRQTKFNSAIQWTTGSIIVASFCTYAYIIALNGYTGRAVGMYASAHRHDDVGVTAAVACRVLSEFSELPRTSRCSVPLVLKERPEHDAEEQKGKD